MLNVELPNGIQRLIQHSTFNTQHSTFNIQHSTFNTQHSTFNIQHSTLNIQHSTFNIQDMDYDVKGNLHEVLNSLPAGVRLVAISKFHPNEYIEEAYAEGQRIFGESHEQELAKKVTSLPEDIEWHFIGHLQTNKVKYIAPYISMIESVDSLKLLKEIEKQAAKHDRVVKVLLELHLAEEDTKSGLSLDACRELLEAGEWREMKHVQICGIMMMASNTDDEQQIAQEFDEAARFFDEIKARYFADDDAFCERSWGMSHDYHIAVKHGSTMVRVGTTIFGPRIY